MHCQICGANAPTRSVSFSQNVGAVVLRFSRTVSGNLCRSCIDSTFWRMTLITLFFGWWGILSFFTTLFILPSNIGQYLGALSLPRTTGAIAPGSAPQVGPGGPGASPPPPG
ncbi:MAG: hypothetical protein U0234_25575 [Sandaracinus sp.]